MATAPTFTPRPFSVVKLDDEVYQQTKTIFDLASEAQSSPGLAPFAASKDFLKAYCDPTAEGPATIATRAALDASFELQHLQRHGICSTHLAPFVEWSVRSACLSECDFFKETSDCFKTSTNSFHGIIAEFIKSLGAGGADNIFVYKKPFLTGKIVINNNSSFHLAKACITATRPGNPLSILKSYTLQDNALKLIPNVIPIMRHLKQSHGEGYFIRAKVTLMNGNMPPSGPFPRAVEALLDYLLKDLAYITGQQILPEFKKLFGAHLDRFKLLMGESCTFTDELATALGFHDPALKMLEFHSVISDDTSPLNSGFVYIYLPREEQVSQWTEAGTITLSRSDKQITISIIAIDPRALSYGPIGISFVNDYPRVNEPLARSVLHSINKFVLNDSRRNDAAAFVKDHPGNFPAAVSSSPVVTGEISYANISTSTASYVANMASALDAFTTTAKAPLRLSIGRPAPDGTWMLFLGSLPDVILLISMFSREIPLIEGDTVIGKILLNIPSNAPLWKDGIVPLLNSGHALDDVPNKPAHIGYLLLQKLATSATHGSHKPDPNIVMHLETAASAIAMSLLIQWNGGVFVSNPSRQINKYIQETMQARNFDSAEKLLNQSIGQLLKSWDNFSGKTLAPPPTVRNRPSHNRQSLFDSLTNTALAPVKPEQFDWSMLDSEDEEEPAPTAGGNASTPQRKRGREDA